MSEPKHGAGLLNPSPPVWGFALVLVLAGLLAWSDSFNGPFVFDDLQNIADNASIRSLWPPWQGGFASGPGIASRPLVHLSLAINWAVSGDRVWSYHAANLAIHILAALALFGLVRRTLLLPWAGESLKKAALACGFFTALIWMLHPLQTASVTYIIQRCESLMGLFFLLSMYLAVRGWGASRPLGWHLAAVGAFWLGTGAKEVIAVLPVVALCYDRVFVSGGFLRAIKRSPVLYAGYAAGWVPVAVLVLVGGTTGTELVKTTTFEYLVTQPEVIWHYLGLALWPSPLALDYLWPAAPLSRAILPAVALAALAVVSAWGFFRKKSWATPGVWFFAILAPSSLVPLADLAFLHRMYLPLAAPVALVVAGGLWAVDRLFAKDPRALRTAAITGACLLGAVAFALGVATYRRNLVFASDLSVWADNAETVPGNPRAHNNLGVALSARGRYPEAVASLEKAIDLKPDYARAVMNLGAALHQWGDPTRGAEQLERGLALDPARVPGRINLGAAYCDLGRTDDAVKVLTEALAIAPDTAKAHSNLALALIGSGDIPGALVHCQQALAIDPGLTDAFINQGVAHARSNNPRAAIESFEAALAMDPAW